MRVLMLAAMGVVLVGCAQSSGVLRMGPDTYTVSVQASAARGGAPGARAMALTEANTVCSRDGKEIMVSDINAVGPSNLPGVDVTFRCLALGDPELRRPIYTTPPTMVIQDKRQ